MEIAAVDAATGQTLLKRPLSEDTHAAMIQPAASSGIAIADHTVFAAATAGTNDGYVIAYRTP